MPGAQNSEQVAYKSSIKMSERLLLVRRIIPVYFLSIKMEITSLIAGHIYLPPIEAGIHTVTGSITDHTINAYLHNFAFIQKSDYLINAVIIHLPSQVFSEDIIFFSSAIYP
jgi:hypothetical protein